MISTDQTFTQLPLGNTEKVVGVTVRLADRISSARDYLRVNTIPGEETFFQLIRVVLKRYYGIEYRQAGERLFEGAWAYEGVAELKRAEDGRFFDEIKPKRAKDIYPKAIRSRRRYIEKYAKVGPPFPPPIYIQAKILEDIIGHEVDGRAIIMVDGARRLVAGCLCRLREMKVVLITQGKSSESGEKSSV